MNWVMVAGLWVSVRCMLADMSTCIRTYITCTLAYSLYSLLYMCFVHPFVEFCC